MTKGNKCGLRRNRPDEGGLGGTERAQYSQSFPEAVYEGLEQGLVVGNGLQYVPVCRHVADGPLAQPRTAQAEDVAEERCKRRLLLRLSDGKNTRA